eukprot:gene15319-23415_t
MQRGLLTARGAVGRIAAPRVQLRVGGRHRLLSTDAPGGERGTGGLRTFGDRAPSGDRREFRANVNVDNGNVVKVRSDTKTASLSGWLTTKLRESKESLTMTTIGMNGLNQIIKALAVSQELLQEEGLLYCKASKAETVTDRGSPASYFAIHVQMRPPTDLSHHNVAPNRVGASSHGTAIMQICEASQKIGQTCILSVAGPESVQKAVISITHLHKYTEFIPMLVKNEEGEYTAIHLKILPLPGAPKVVFVSKYTRPQKLAGYLRHVFRDENSAKIVKVVASVESQEALRTAAKACENATDFLEQDRIPLTMSVELTHDDEALSSGSYVFTLTRELPKESTALKVTVGLGNLSIGRVVEQIKAGVESGRLVHLRSTLQGVPTALEALSTLSETTPVSFYSRPKEVGFGPGQEKIASPQLDRFFIEFMVERMTVPDVIEHKQGSDATLATAMKTHSSFTYLLKDIEKLIGALHRLTEISVAAAGKHSLQIVALTHGLGIQFEITKKPYDAHRSLQNRDISRQIRYSDGTTATTQKIAQLHEEGAFQAAATNR